MNSNSFMDELDRTGIQGAEESLGAPTLSHGIQRWSRQLSGHLWTLFPYGQSTLTTRPLFGGDAYVHEVVDPQRGPVPIYGQMYPSKANEGRLVILLHGLASTPTDPNLRQLTRALNQSQCDVLSLALRGSLGRGSDHYHAGLTDDLQAVLSDPRLGAYDEVFLVGYSLGGQMALRYTIDHAHPRLKGTVALCAPISMRPCQMALDTPALGIYRLPILSILKWTYHRLAWNARKEGKTMACDLKRIRRIGSFYEWDDNVVCSRYGYPSVEAYYETVSVAPHLKAIHTPTLLVFGADDPIVPLSSIQSDLRRASSAVDVAITRPGGHLGFPRRLDLNQPGPLGLPHQVSAWIQSIS